MDKKYFIKIKTDIVFLTPEQEIKDVFKFILNVTPNQKFYDRLTECLIDAILKKYPQFVSINGHMNIAFGCNNRRFMFSGWNENEPIAIIHIIISRIVRLD